MDINIPGMNVSLPLEDIIAPAIFFYCWYFYSVKSEKMAMKQRMGVLAIMHSHRLSWMRAMVRRENRLSDVNAVGNLMRSISFFASTSVLIVAALVNVIGNHDKVGEILHSIPFSQPNNQLLWEMKILAMGILFIFAFFKFTWSLRQYNYVNVLIIGAPPVTEPDEVLEAYAVKAAELTTNAARHFGYGLRAYNFALAVLGWFINAYVFIAVTMWVMWVLYRREFRSKTLEHITMN